ncbi:MAG: GNAT family N-acetyltransferase [Myxococcota bacterium]
MLDNFVWQAISTEQSALGVVGPRGLAGRFPAEVSPFCGLAEASAEAWEDLASVLGTADVAILMGPPVDETPKGWTCLLEEVATQWVAGETDAPSPRFEFAPLGADDVPDMLDLTARTEPGPFLPSTIRFGRYWGVRRGGKLVAMAGERMRAGGCVEISAVCVDPSAQREGLGAAASLFVAERIREEGGLPILHVRQGNDPALALYARIGFTRRTDRFVYVLAPPGWAPPDEDPGWLASDAPARPEKEEVPET